MFCFGKILHNDIYTYNPLHFMCHKDNLFFLADDECIGILLHCYILHPEIINRKVISNIYFYIRNILSANMVYIRM